MLAAWKQPKVAACSTWANTSTAGSPARLPSNSQRSAASTKLASSTCCTEKRAKMRLMAMNTSTSATTPSAHSKPMAPRA
ncbi:hypothetical protein D3C78_1062120 [compost metagenome]